MSWKSLLSPSSGSATGAGGFPTGSFTVDSQGQILISTLPQAISATRLSEIGTRILNTFREARELRVPVSEITVQFTAMKLLARELRGGAIIFVIPRASNELTPTHGPGNLNPL